jgi:AcrR family transcriptional regulator
MYRKINDKRAVLSQKLIYKALADIMHEKEFEKITITEVVEKAEVARSTFYRNFDNLHDVLKLATDQLFEELAKSIKEYYASEKFDGHQLFLKPFLRFFYEDSELIELLVHARYYEVLLDAMGNMYANLIDKDSLSDGEITEHFGYFVASRKNLAISILVEWIKNGKDILPDDLAEVIYTQFQEAYERNVLM